MVVEVVLAERAEGDLRELDRVARPVGMRDRAHERLVRPPDVRIDHVEVALVDRHVDRLADRPARVVEVGRHVRELHEVPEVLEGPVAAPVVEVADERRAVVGREDRVRIADLDGPRRVTGVLGVRLRRARLDDLAAHPAREPHQLALDVRAAVAERDERLGVAPEDDPDLFQDRVGVVLEEREALLVQDLERLQVAGQEGRALSVGRRLASGVTRGATATWPATGAIVRAATAGSRAVDHRPGPPGLSIRSHDRR